MFNLTLKVPYVFILEYFIDTMILGINKVFFFPFSSFIGIGFLLRKTERKNSDPVALHKPLCYQISNRNKEATNKFDHTYIMDLKPCFDRFFILSQVLLQYIFRNFDTTRRLPDPGVSSTVYVNAVRLSESLFPNKQILQKLAVSA